MIECAKSSSGGVDRIFVRVNGDPSVTTPSMIGRIGLLLDTGEHMKNVSVI